MGNTITKGNSFGEVVEALKLKGVKAFRGTVIYLMILNLKQKTILQKIG